MKAGLVAPLYLSVSWLLTVSYQLFTDTAVRTIGTNIGFLWPNTGEWITSNIQTIVFIYAFTWIFVLSSVIPSVILGKERKVLTQYMVVLILSSIAFFMPDILLTFAGIDVNQILAMSAFLENPAVAAVYLAFPYLFMLGLDLRCRLLMKRKKQADYACKYLAHTNGTNKVDKEEKVKNFKETEQKLKNGE